MSEEWRPIPSAPGWMASSRGRLRAHLKVKMPKGGIKELWVFPTFGVFDEKKQRFKQSVMNKTKWVAPLVCEAFNGAKPSPKHHCLHVDEDSTNNVPTNLTWGTHKQNHNAPKYLERRRSFMLQLWAKRRSGQCQERN